MKFKTGDQVMIMAGKDKGKTGKISKIIKTQNKVIITGLNLVKKHLKPDANNQSGGIIDVEAPLAVSNIMLIDPKTNKPTRVGYTVNKDNKKVRIAKKSGAKID